MRVIAGKFRSRPLRSLRGLDIRPTSDRLRETLFDVLTAGNPEALSRSVWLDLFAGTGAVGIEALSRGAAMVYFVESSKRAAGVIRDNLASLQIASGFELLQTHCSAAIAELQGRGIAPDFIFIDPPYRLYETYRNALRQLTAAELSSQALIVLEHEKQFDPGAPFGRLRRTRLLKQGDAALSFYKAG
jgi:16S rRNA (guanine966-N2)-methyltransferase